MNLDGVAWQRRKPQHSFWLDREMLELALGPDETTCVIVVSGLCDEMPTMLSETPWGKSSTSTGAAVCASSARNVWRREAILLKVVDSNGRDYWAWKMRIYFST
jgi:hypothetical protein